MNVKELNKEELIQLKQNYYIEKCNEGSDCVSYGELANIDDFVSDEFILDHYKDVCFVEEDFSKNF